MNFITMESAQILSYLPWGLAIVLKIALILLYRNRQSLINKFEGIKPRFLEAELKLKETYKQLEELKSEKFASAGKLQELLVKSTSLESENEHLLNRLKEQKEEFNSLREQSAKDFKLLAQQIFEEKSEKFTKINQQQIHQILQPLGKDIQQFKSQVQEVYEKEAKQRFSLEEKVKELAELNKQISEEARNLTHALKGQSKTQGDWGERILENILERSGLVKGREYLVQSSIRNEESRIQRPDIAVLYPDDRCVIIDSKLSLVAYEQWVNEEDEQLKNQHLQQHLQSIRKHIDDLAGKKYDDWEHSLDFVMMFVPIEPAYITAIQADPELWNKAYEKRIILISPTNLIAALKLLADIWKREKQNQNAMEIARRGQISI